MLEALKEAKKALDINEVPIGAVIVKDGMIIGRGYNMRESKNDPTLHAEIIAIKEASNYLSSWRLTECEMYVTIEPCMMCSGAIYQSRIKKLYYGSKDLKMGMVDSNLELLYFQKLNHKVEVESGILSDECSMIVKNFFKQLRIKKSAK